ncbi:MAG: polymer-forming cytoskeletal protein, partial [Oscillospiraceae bacterium]
MANKDNMKQAMRELLNKVGIGEEGTEPEWENEQGAAKMMENERYAGGSREQQTRFADGMINRNEHPEKESDYNEVPLHIVPPVTKGTVISAGTSIFGDLRAEGDVEILGKLKGNLEASGNVRVTGKVLGDVKGNSVELSACTVQGNITASAGMLINAETIVVGDVIADTLTTNGKIKGSVQVE